jgi:hypothetical protein
MEVGEKEKDSRRNRGRGILFPQVFGEGEEEDITCLQEGS